MFIQSIIEVIVGLVFTWFVLSTATIQIQEWIAARLRWRANDLENAIRKMLNDRSLTRLFYDHPIIRGLAGRDMNQNFKPSYIPANQFSTVLLSLILEAGSESALLVHGLYGLRDQLKIIKPPERRRSAQADLERILELARLSPAAQDGTPIDNLILATLEKEIRDFGARYAEMKDAVEALRKKAAADRSEIEKLSESLGEGSSASAQLRALLTGTLAMGVVNPDLRLALNSLLIGIDRQGLKDEDVLNLLKSNIETWFNDTMDRLSGWYKRKAQVAAFIIGLLIASLLNIDTLHMADQLWREPTIREIINAHADVILQEYGAGLPEGEGDPLAAVEFLQRHYLGLPLGWSVPVVKLLPGESCAFVPAQGTVFGFSWGGECRRPAGVDAAANGWVWLLAKLTGLLITGVASAQGSSFWFDLLMKIVNVRSAGIKPAA